MKISRYMALQNNTCTGAGVKTTTTTTNFRKKHEQITDENQFYELCGTF